MHIRCLLPFCNESYASLISGLSHKRNKHSANLTISRIFLIRYLCNVWLEYLQNGDSDTVHY